MPEITRIQAGQQSLGDHLRSQPTCHSVTTARTRVIPATPLTVTPVSTLGFPLNSLGPSYDAALDLRLYAKVLSRASYLAELVQVFNVHLTAPGSEVVYKWLARCLPRLPNLHTFQILLFPAISSNGYVLNSVCAEHFREAFAEMGPLLKVHTLTLPYRLWDYIDMKRVFPSLRHIAIHPMGWWSLYDIRPEAESIPRDIQMLTLPTMLCCLEIQISHLFPDLRITPRLALHKNGPEDFVDVSNALPIVLDGWKRVDPVNITSCLTTAKKDVDGGVPKERRLRAFCTSRNRACVRRIVIFEMIALALLNPNPRWHAYDNGQILYYMYRLEETLISDIEFPQAPSSISMTIPMLSQQKKA
ncbi:hypothetical protein BDZ89DRAFT_1146964 [Hymenopellis radicata]|nr:hypothetical protein BDZ89DRAFT_1146964 [Hymenopellis radicata]